MHRHLLLSASLALVGAGLLASPAQAQPRHEGGFQRADANADGVVTREEFRSQRLAQFEFIDTNKDAALSQAELDVARQHPMGARRPPQQREREPRGDIRRDQFVKAPQPMIERYDRNRDGQVSAAEIEADRAARFDRADANKDGVLNLQERRALGEEMRAAARARAFAALDADRNGRVSREEFAAAAQPGFDRMDRNRDGRISRDEIGAGRRVQERRP
jgi:Ca2+-binding EF-hand superfamily protein